MGDGAFGLGVWPPSEKESGVTLMTPMMHGRAKSSPATAGRGASMSANRSASSGVALSAPKPSHFRARPPPSRSMTSQAVNPVAPPPISPPTPPCAASRAAAPHTSPQGFR
jgi:hypothetical protein